MSWLGQMKSAAPKRRARDLGDPLGVQLSTLYFLNQAIISFHACSAASLR
jgi:hypothetical protein